MSIHCEIRVVYFKIVIFCHIYSKVAWHWVKINEYTLWNTCSIFQNSDILSYIFDSYLTLSKINVYTLGNIVVYLKIAIFLGYTFDSYLTLSKINVYTVENIVMYFKIVIFCCMYSIVIWHWGKPMSTHCEIL